MLIDCDTCSVRGHGCADCLVAPLLGLPPDGRLDAEERRALDVLAEAGLLPSVRCHEGILSADATPDTPLSRRRAG